MKIKILLYILTAALLSGCSMNRSGNSASVSPYTEYAYDRNDSMPAAPAPMVAYEVAGGGFGYDPAPMPTVSPDYPSAPSQMGLMFIKTANVSVSTPRFDAAVNELRHIVNAYGGFFESSSLFNNLSARNPYKRLNATIRVPADQYEQTLRALEGLGKHLSTSESSREVSGEYYDLESRVRTKETEEVRLLELIDQAKELYQIIELEQRLGQVRTDIEVYKTRMMRIDSLASFSTIHIELTEAPENEKVYGDSFLDRIAKGFRESAEATLAFLQNIVIFIAYISVPVIILGVLAAVAAVILKKFKKRRDGLG